MNQMDFYKRIALVGEKIPAGKVATYGQIALLCGKPNNSRQVGYALNRGKAGKGFPAYRVLNSKGYLSGAASFETPDMQRRLLEKEGVKVSDDDKVDLKKFGWHHTLEEAKTLYEIFEKKGI